MIKYGSYGIQRGFERPRSKKSNTLKYLLVSSVLLSVVAVAWFILEYKYDTKKQLFTLTDTIDLTINDIEDTTTNKAPEKPLDKIEPVVTKDIPTLDQTEIEQTTQADLVKPKEAETPIPEEVSESISNDKPTIINFPQDSLAGKLQFEIDNPLQEKVAHIIDKAVFGANSTELNQQAKNQLEQVAKVLLDAQQVSIMVSGHTDNTGTKQDNEYFSLARAKSVRTFLINQGIDIKRIRVSGYGDTKPLLPNNSLANRIKNRRIEIKIINASTGN